MLLRTAVSGSSLPSNSRERYRSVPWDDAGAYLRLSVTFLAKNPADEDRILVGLGHRPGDARLEF